MYQHKVSPSIQAKIDMQANETGSDVYPDVISRAITAGFRQPCECVQFIVCRDILDLLKQVVDAMRQVGAVEFEVMKMEDDECFPFPQYHTPTFEDYDYYEVFYEPMYDRLYNRQEDNRLYYAIYMQGNCGDRNEQNIDIHGFQNGDRIIMGF